MKDSALARLIKDTFNTRSDPTNAPTHTNNITVELAVQESWGGHRFKFTHTISTVSHFEAEVAARKAAISKGYEVWWILDCYEGKPHKEK